MRLLAYTGSRFNFFSGGATTALLKDGITRAPVVELPNLVEAARLKAWISQPNSFEALSQAVHTASEYCHLQSVSSEYFRLV